MKTWHCLLCDNLDHPITSNVLGKGGGSRSLLPFVSCSHSTEGDIIDESAKESLWSALIEHLKAVESWGEKELRSWRYYVLVNLVKVVKYDKLECVIISVGEGNGSLKPYLGLHWL